MTALTPEERADDESSAMEVARAYVNGRGRQPSARESKLVVQYLDRVLAENASQKPESEIDRLRRVESLARKFINEHDADLAVGYADPISAFNDLKSALFPEGP